MAGKSTHEVVIQKSFVAEFRNSGYSSLLSTGHYHDCIHSFEKLPLAFLDSSLHYKQIGF